jgi:hypothetical protein
MPAKRNSEGEIDVGFGLMLFFLHQGQGSPSPRPYRFAARPMLRVAAVRSVNQRTAMFVVRISTCYHDPLSVTRPELALSSHAMCKYREGLRSGCLSRLQVIPITAQPLRRGFNAVPDRGPFPSNKGLRANLYPSGFVALDRCSVARCFARSEDFPPLRSTHFPFAITARRESF